MFRALRSSGAIEVRVQAANAREAVSSSEWKRNDDHPFGTRDRTRDRTRISGAPDMTTAKTFRHERLDVYRCALASV